MNLIIFLLACAGMVNIIVDGSIFNFLRNWLSLHLPKYLHIFFNDYSVVGFWSGLFLGYILIDNHFFNILACGFASSFIADFTANLLNYLQANSIIE